MSYRVDIPFNFVCPHCHIDLVNVQQTSDQEATPPTEGATLICHGCNGSYPIRGGVRRFVPDSGYSGSFGYQWNKFRRTQLDSYTRLPLSRDRLFHASGWPSRLDGDSILEAGSGAGRFTEVLASTGARVLTFDLSSAVDANYANNGSFGNVTVFQASIFDIPLRPSSFDKVICLGVLQHTPNPDKAFSSLARMVRPGGHLVVDVYARGLRAMLSWKYILRPITKRMNQATLFRAVSALVPPLVPVSVFMRKIAGGVGARLVPILQYAHWGLPDDLNRQWAVLDTFDMLSPAHDSPRSVAEVEAWFVREGYVDVWVGRGPNGIVARGRRPCQP